MGDTATNETTATAQRTAPESTGVDVAPWHLRGNWAPVLDERTDTGLRVEGTIPPELQGTYVRTGPNPASGTSDHWFYGDGMLHGVRLADGRAQWYRNRFIRTPNITDPLEDQMAAMADLTRGTGNTHVIAHNRQLLCLEDQHGDDARLQRDPQSRRVHGSAGLLRARRARDRHAVQVQP